MIEAVAIVSGATSLVAIVLVAVLAFKWAASVGELGDARVADAGKAGQLAIAAADLATWKAKCENEKHRADVLDDELAKSDADVDPAGARDRVLQAWRDARDRANSASRSGPVAVPAEPTATPAEPVVDPLASRV